MIKPKKIPLPNIHPGLLMSMYTNWMETSFE